MKKKNNTELATKADLEHTEKKLEKHFDDQFTKRLTESLEAFRRELDLKIEVMNENWERRFTAFESRLISLIDPVLQEIKTSRQERIITTGQISEIRDTTNNHEKRIKKLEHS